MPDYAKFFRDRTAASRGMDRGRRLDQVQAAALEYMEARQLVPIQQDDLETLGDPFRCPAGFRGWHDWEGDILRACDHGRDVEAVIAERMKANGLLWRPMQRHERLTPGELLGLMSIADRETAMELFGIAKVATTMARDGGLAMMKYQLPESP